ncbi:hypothetical protein BpHYR1_030520, partial [Brachionus plicatilis]
VYVRPCTKYPIHGIKPCVAKQGDTKKNGLIINDGISGWIRLCLDNLKVKYHRTHLNGFLFT